MARAVKCQKFTSTDVHVPVVKLRPQPKKDKKGTGTVEDEAEDWTAAVAALLEWVGMACLGSQRYFDSLSPSSETHLYVWQTPNQRQCRSLHRVIRAPFDLPYSRGYASSLARFSGPPIRSEVDQRCNVRQKSALRLLVCLLFHLKLNPTSRTTTVPSANSSLDALSSPQFLSITSHGCPWSPVSYISPSTLTPTTGKATNLQTPLRYPRKTAEDTWSLVLVPDALAESAGGNQTDAGWIMAESIGKWDAR